MYRGFNPCATVHPEAVGPEGFEHFPSLLAEAQPGAARVPVGFSNRAERAGRVAMVRSRKEKLVVRRVVSRVEEVVCESPLLEGLYGEKANAPSEVARVLRPLLENEPAEVFVALLLNGKNAIQGVAEISRGTLTWAVVHPREVFGPAIREGAGAVIVAHNHPSGDPIPSPQDIELTKRLQAAGELLGIPLLDHLVIGSGGKFTSLRERFF
jgi:DNA repair protein RadC